MLRTAGDDRVWSVAVSSGRLLAAGYNDGTVRLWDPDSGAERDGHKKHNDQVFAVAFSPDGRTLASGGADGSVRVWEVDRTRGRAVLTEWTRLGGHVGGVQALAFSPDGRNLASGGWDGRVRLWRADEPREPGP